MPLITAQKAFYRQGTLDQIDLVVYAEASSTDKLEQLRAEVQSALGNNYSVVFPASQGSSNDPDAEQLSDWVELLKRYGSVCWRVSCLQLLLHDDHGANPRIWYVANDCDDQSPDRAPGDARSCHSGILSSLFGLVLGLALAVGLSKMMGVVLALDLSQMSLLKVSS